MLNQKVIPALSSFKMIEKFIETDLKYCVLLNFHINHLDSVIQKIKERDKKVLVHIDLINGLCGDKYGAEYLSQKLHVDGIISTKSSVLITAKANKCLAIQRVFLIDSTSLRKSIDLINKVEPDILEVLPGISIISIHETINKLNIPTIGGGLINTEEEVKQILDSGLIGVTTGNQNLWKLDK